MQHTRLRRCPPLQTAMPRVGSGAHGRQTRSSVGSLSVEPWPAVGSGVVLQLVGLQAEPARGAKPVELLVDRRAAEPPWALAAALQSSPLQASRAYRPPLRYRSRRLPGGRAHRRACFAPPRPSRRFHNLGSRASCVVLLFHAHKRQGRKRGVHEHSRPIHPSPPPHVTSGTTGHHGHARGSPGFRGRTSARPGDPGERGLILTQTDPHSGGDGHR